MSATSSVRVRIYDGRRRLMADPTGIFIRIIDGNQQQQLAREFAAADLTFNDLPFFDNFGDNYTVLASRPGYVGAGFHPIKLTGSREPEVVDLMLLPTPSQFNFDTSRFAALRQSHPGFCAVMCGVTPDAGSLFDGLLRNDPASDNFTGRQAADLLNILTAMQEIALPAGTPLDYLKGVIGEDPDHGVRPDRFFSWADPALVDQVRQAAAQGRFDPEPNPKLFHPGATSSFKENRFGEANVQLTFHENDRREVDGVNCILVEPDIDYYRDLGAHGLLEVLPGLFPSGMTDARVVYVLRWIAGRRQPGLPEFDPPYWIEPCAP
jgi:hypothetical protein